jgi:heme/copper-type cytochrome/quinol oxidase subunit 2
MAFTRVRQRAHHRVVGTMFWILNALVLVAQDVGGRGENPDEGSGIITIVVIAAAVLVVGLLLAAFFARGRARARSMRRRPDVEGHTGRVGEFRGE